MIIVRCDICGVVFIFQCKLIYKQNVQLYFKVHFVSKYCNILDMMDFFFIYSFGPECQRECILVKLLLN